MDQKIDSDFINMSFYDICRNSNFISKFDFVNFLDKGKIENYEVYY